MLVAIIILSVAESLFYKLQTGSLGIRTCLYLLCVCTFAFTTQTGNFLKKLSVIFEWMSNSFTGLIFYLCCFPAGEGNRCRCWPFWWNWVFSLRWISLLWKIQSLPDWPTYWSDLCVSRHWQRRRSNHLWSLSKSYGWGKFHFSILPGLWMHLQIWMCCILLNENVISM